MMMMMMMMMMCCSLRTRSYIFVNVRVRDTRSLHQHIPSSDWTNLEPLALDIVCHPINTSGTVVIYLPAQPYQNHRRQGPCGDIGRKGIAKKTTIVHVSVLLHGIGVIILFFIYVIVIQSL